MKILCNHFGNPQDKFKTIHISGTNGKGSVAFKTANILQKAGFKTGLLTSPHISTFRERITINHQKLQETELVNYADIVFEAIRTKNLNATLQEVLAMIAFLQFAQQKVDYAVVECNMGGRLDPTNIIEKPQVTAITSISFDHVEYLGSTLEAIAAEKAGIIKAGVPCIIGPSVIQDSVFIKAKQMNGQLIQVKKKNYLKANQEIVEKVIESLGIQVPNEFFTQSINLGQPCRLEKVPSHQIQQIIRSHEPPIVYLDVCSNPSAVESVIKEIINRHPTSKIQVVCGFSKFKDVTSMLHFLATNSHISHIHPISSDELHLSPIDEIQDKISKIQKLLNSFDRPSNFRSPIQQGDIQQTLDQCLKQAHHNKEILLVCGSYNVMKEVRAFFFYEEERDQICYNYC